MIYFKKETVFKIWYLRFILSYPTHFHNHVTPKLGLTLQNQYCFSKWDTISNVSAKNEDFCYGAEKGPYGHPPIMWSLLGEGERKIAKHVMVL